MKSPWSKTSRNSTPSSRAWIEWGIPLGDTLVLCNIKQHEFFDSRWEEPHIPSGQVIDKRLSILVHGLAQQSVSQDLYNTWCLSTWIRHEPFNTSDHSAATCQWSSLYPAGSSRMSTPAICVASGITTVFSWRAHPALSKPSLQNQYAAKK